MAMVNPVLPTITLLAITYFQSSHCGVIVDVKMVDFNNSQSRLMNGECCEQKATDKGAQTLVQKGTCTANAYCATSSCQTDKCDNKFKFHGCLIENGREWQTGIERKTAILKKNTDEFKFEEQFDFSKTEKQSPNLVISNPQEFNGTEYKGEFRINVTVSDDDGWEQDFPINAQSSPDQTVADLVRDIQEAAIYNKANAEFKKATLVKEYAATTDPSKKHQVVVNFEYRVYCQDRYLIPSCKEYCVDTDNSTHHYTCDYPNGKRVCKACWKGDHCSDAVTNCSPTDPGNTKDDNTVAIVTPIVIIAALAGMAAVMYYFLIRKKKKENKVEDDQTLGADTPKTLDINTPDV